ncbi:MAG: vWA domain-containing protein [Anaerolineae bacterium]
MEERITRFLAALRAAGVRVSLAESEDAWHAIQHLGIADKETFRIALRTTLVKEARDLPTFDEMFGLYFGVDQPPLENPQSGLNEDEQQQMDQAMQTLREALEGLARDLKQLLEWLMSGQAPTQEELQELAQKAGIENANAQNQAHQYARRMQRMLGWDQLQQVLEMLWKMLAAQGMDSETIQKLKEQVAGNEEALAQMLEQFAGQAIGERMIEQQAKRKASASDLMQRPFESLTQAEMEVLRDEVRRLAARLRSRVSLRQKRGEKGRLDAKGTIRANLRYGGVPLELQFRTRRLRPKLVTFLDVSTSMRPVTEFFLRLLYALQDQIQKSHSFAYIDHIEDVTEDLEHLPPGKALERIIERLPPGHYNTDFGASLRQFEADHLDTVDSTTTVIVLSDARNNYNDPAIDQLSDLSRRSRRTVWLNPEYPAQWGTGDSDMLTYAPHCKDVYQVRNLAQLTEAVDKLLVD